MEHDREGRSYAYRAHHFDMSVVHIYQLFGQVQTDTRTRGVETVDLVIAAETLEQHAAFLRRDTDTFVLHGQRHKARFGAYDDTDRFAVRRELERIAEQVP